MHKIKGNEHIKITYTGTLEDGEIFEEISEDNPQELTLGSNKLLPALEKALIGMQKGETRSIRIPAEYGFGPHNKNLVQTIDRSVFAGRIEPKVGMIMALSIEKNKRKEQIPATVISVDDSQVIVDYNHPLSGKTLYYTITLVEIIDQ